MIINQKVLFQIPLLIGNVKNINNDIIIKDALINKDNYLSLDVSNTHSEDTHIPMSDELQKLYNNIMSDIENQMSLTLSLKSHWCIISKPNTSIHIHDHIDSDISVAYYPQVSVRSGDIIFQWGDDFSKRWGENRYGITPEVGMYIAFPGHLKHFVTKNLSKKDRISLSANLNIEKKVK